jgi:hypothetical protein
MIGKKRLSEVRASVLKTCAQAGIDPARWFDEQIGKLEHTPLPNAREIETLRLIRDGLQSKTPGAKRSSPIATA